MAIQYDGFRVESGLVTLDKGANYGVIPVKRVDGAALQHTSHGILMVLAVAAPALAYAFSAGGGGDLSAVGILFGVIFALGYFATRSTFVVVQGGGMSLSVRASGSRKKAEAFIDSLMEEVQSLPN